MSILTQQKGGTVLSSSTFFSMMRRGNVLVVCPTGPRLGEREASIMAPEIKQAISATRGTFKGLVLDLSHVQIMTSFGLGMCIELRNYARNHRAATVLFGLVPEIRELFRIMKVDRLFTMALTPAQLGEFIAN